MKIAVIGAGGWGTTLANLIAEKFPVKVWIREEELYKIMKEEKENTWFLPGVKLNNLLEPIHDFKELEDIDVFIFAVPSQFLRQTVKHFSNIIKKEAILINVAKGLENNTYKRMTEILVEETGNKNVIALSGPNHAEEVGKKIPTATVIASDNKEILEKVKPIFERDYFKVYLHDDVIGVEICGAIKNITAIAAGVVDGLGLGDNANGAIITYGLTEMNKFGKFFGAKQKTIYCLAGGGDLIATCTSHHSRNRFVGKHVASCKSFEEIKELMHGMVAEGIATTKSVHEFAEKNNIEMPMTSQVYKVLFEKKELKKAIKDLISFV